MSRPIYLHEIIDIVGQRAYDYMEHTKGQHGHQKINFELQGTWYTVGITGRWSQVINMWDVPGGWDGWYESVDRLNLKRRSNAHLEGWWDVAYNYRTGGFDRALAGAPGSPTTDELVAAGVSGSLFVHEITEVRPGAALDYLAAVHEVRVPLLAEYGHAVTGLYEVLMNDYEVVTIWATDVASHVELGKAFDVARGLAPGNGDDRLVAWGETARTFTTRFREELMTPAAGTKLGPDEYEVDVSVDE